MERVRAKEPPARNQAILAPVRRGVLQRKCACGGTPGPTGECESCRKKKLRRRASDSSAPSSINHSPSSISEVPPIVHEVLRSPGQPLDADTRAFMEPRFGHDFSHVRLHADSQAANSARAVNAQAYTVGGRMVFGEGSYAPRTQTGQRLLAHELTHVVQQSGLDGKPLIPSKVSESSDASERQADQIATNILTALPLRKGLGFDDKAYELLPRSIAWDSPRYSVSPAILSRKERPWPVNGYVINNSKESVIVWNDTRQLFIVAAGATSARFTEDVDHIRGKNGQWYKIGPNTVTVDSAGKISGYECAVSNYGEDCPAPSASSPSLPSVPTYGVTPVPNK